MVNTNRIKRLHLKRKYRTPLAISFFNRIVDTLFNACIVCRYQIRFFIHLRIVNLELSQGFFLSVKMYIQSAAQSPLFFIF